MLDGLAPLKPNRHWPLGDLSSSTPPRHPLLPRGVGTPHCGRPGCCSSGVTGKYDDTEAVMPLHFCAADKVTIVDKGRKIPVEGLHRFIPLLRGCKIVCRNNRPGCGGVNDKLCRYRIDGSCSWANDDNGNNSPSLSHKGHLDPEGPSLEKSPGQARATVL